MNYEVLVGFDGVVDGMIVVLILDVVEIYVFSDGVEF